MTLKRLLAQMTVSDLDRAVSWYARFFGREPDTRPMDGLVEWHLHDAVGIQVWLDPERAGRSTMVFEESDLDGRAVELDAEGLPYEGPQAVTASRIVRLNDLTATGSSSPASSVQRSPRTRRVGQLRADCPPEVSGDLA